MIFGKKKRMIDVRELQKRGIVRIPKKDIVVPTDNNGFVELGKNSKSSESKPTVNFFGSQNNSSSSDQFSSSTNGYNKREVDTKIIELDNKIYKLEQRIELLEKKVGVNQPTDSVPSGIISW